MTHPNALATLPSSPAAASPKTGDHAGRVRVLTEIAERYDELVQPGARNGTRGSGDYVPLTPGTYTKTVREFERLAKQLREHDRQLWWHLNGWWLAATTRTLYHCPRCGPCHQPEHTHPKRKGHGTLTVKCSRVVAWKRIPGARETDAKAAIRWMAERWGLSTEPMLPDELRIAA